MDTNGRKWGRDPPEIRGPKSEVGGPKTGRNGLHPVFLLFPVFLLGCGFLSFGGPKIPICVNLRSFAVVGGLKTRISAGKQEIFTKTGGERSHHPVFRLGIWDRTAVGHGGLANPPYRMRRGREKAEYPITNVQYPITND
jgi:hypothetical protein